MIARRCVICGEPFECYPSDNKVTCSKDCRRERQRRIQTGKAIKWSTSARKKLSERGQTDNLRMGTVSAMESPIAGRFETNRNAKIWILIDPSGREHVVRNLLLWARENTVSFGKPPEDHAARQIADGFRAIALTLAGKRGTPGKPRKAMTYFGWSLKCPPQNHPDR